MNRSFLPVVILTLGLGIIQQSIAFSQKITATGTGRTTGHIATLLVTNQSKSPITVTLGPYLIPSTKKFQGYAVPGVYPITVPPKESATIPLTGYCTFPGLPPAGDGEQLPEFDSWVNADLAPAILPGSPLSRKDGFIPTDTPGGANYPGTNIPFPYTINIDKHPEAAARLVIDIVRAITNTYDDLYDAGLIHTPFSGDRLREEEAIEQQIIWHVLGMLTGKPYNRDDFRDNLIRQLELNILTPFEEAPPAVREELENGVDEFWTTFVLVGVEAKVLSVSTESDQDKNLNGCRLICPPDNAFVDGRNVHFEWKCNDAIEGPLELKLSFGNEPPIVISGLTGTGHSLSQPLSEGRTYKAVLSYPAVDGAKEAVPIAFNTEEDCYSQLQEIIRRLADLWEQVQNANDNLEGNSLVAEARTIEMVAQLLNNPKQVTDMFDQWLGSTFPLPDLSTVENPNDLVDYINTNINTIKQALEYAKKLLKFTSAQNNRNAQGLIDKIDAALSALEKQEDFESMYNELRSAISDIRGYLGDKLQEYTQSRVRETAQKLIAARLGAKAAGSIMSAAMDAWNFISALIKAGQLAEAKKLYYLMYFDMLKKANDCPRYRIDKTWNSPTNGLPQIEWADCKEVLNKKITLTAVVKCWVRKPNGAPNEGRFEERRINFKGGVAQLVRQSFQSDCDDVCAFQFQLDLADLTAKAKGCEHAFVEIHASVGGGPAKAVFAGVFRP